MREITLHKAHDKDRQPVLLACENIGVGGAEQSYRICYEHHLGRPANINIEFVSLDREGITNEALLAIVIDRLEGFQAGEFPCQENADALQATKLALGALHTRTLKRIARGVENQAKA